MRIFSFIIIVSLLLSCKKPWIDHVRGTVVEFGSGEPVKGAVVYLHKDPKKQYREESIIDSAITNQKGEYIINFSKEMRNYYSISCKCSGYFEAPESMSSDLEHGRTARNIILTPNSYLKLRFIKTAFSSKYVSGGAQPHRGLSFISHIYNPSDTAKFYQPFDYTSPYLRTIPGNQNLTISWAVRDIWDYRNQAGFGKTFYTKGGDTSLLTITFD